jgi:hypothetical protein
MPALPNAHALVVAIADYVHLTKPPRTQDPQTIAEMLTDERRGQPSLTHPGGGWPRCQAARSGWGRSYGVVIGVATPTRRSSERLSRPGLA